MPSIIDPVKPSAQKPLVVETLRGSMVENRHEVDLQVLRPDGKVPLSFGDPERLVYPRSAVKLIQALPFVESGAPEAFDLDNRHLSFACASHSSEPEHLALAEDWLERLGYEDQTFECGGHAPMDPRTGIPTSDQAWPRRYNNCSGKHLGFLSACKAKGWDPKGYIMPGHPIQQSILGTFEQVCGLELDSQPWAPDGCGIPTIAMPIGNLALGFARLSEEGHVPPARYEAAQRLMAAKVAEPFFMAGRGRACTIINAALKGKAVVKVGAEGVYCAAIPGQGLGLALKANDGSIRAAEVALVWALEGLDLLDEQARAALSGYLEPVIQNSIGVQTGTMRVVTA